MKKNTEEVAFEDVNELIEVSSEDTDPSMTCQLMRGALHIP